MQARLRHLAVRGLALLEVRQGYLLLMIMRLQTDEERWIERWQPDYLPPTIKGLCQAIQAFRLPCVNEQALQDGIATALKTAGIEFEREVVVSPRDRFDFFIEPLGLVIEVKTKPGRSALIRQIKRYADLSLVRMVAVVSRTPVSLPFALSGKRIINIEIWRNFLL